MNWFKELLRRLTGQSMTGIGSKPKYTIIYKGDGKKKRRHIPFKPPIGSFVHGYTKNGMIMIESEDGVLYEFTIPELRDSNWIISQYGNNRSKPTKEKD